MTSTTLPLLVLDTETGGLSPKEHSLLSIAGVAWYPNKKPQPIFSFMVCEELITTTAKAMEVNKLDLKQIEREGLSPTEAVTAIRAGLDLYFGKERQPLMLAGHNISFDIGFVQRLYRLAKQNFWHDFSKKNIDTVTLFNFFMASGLISPGKADGDRMFSSLGIPMQAEHRHTALGDAWATALSLSRMALALRRGRLPAKS